MLDLYAYLGAEGLHQSGLVLVAAEIACSNLTAGAHSAVLLHAFMMSVRFPDA